MFLIYKITKHSKCKYNINLGLSLGSFSSYSVSYSKWFGRQRSTCVKKYFSDSLHRNSVIIIKN